MAMTQPSSSRASLPPPSPPFLLSPRTSWSPARRRAIASSLKLGAEEIAQLAHNKVLLAAAVASAIGQLWKPFTSAARIRGGGRDVDLRAALRSGGMPSTHSAGVVAVATSLGLERGLADSIFGMTVVFAAIVMYDAQGVRREVGNHAKILNKMSTLRDTTAQCIDEDDSVDSTSEFHSRNPDRSAQLLSVPEDITSYRSNATSSSSQSSATRSSRLSALPSSDADVARVTELNCNQLSESVGHTELQVLAGALLGFVVSLVICATL